MLTKGKDKTYRMKQNGRKQTILKQTENCVCLTVMSKLRLKLMKVMAKNRGIQEEHGGWCPLILLTWIRNFLRNL